jgi:hypothetical protein
MLVEDIIAAAEKGDLKYEINSYGGDTDKEIGVRYLDSSKNPTGTMKSTWAWWTFWDDDSDNGRYAFFRGTYNQVTGTTDKSYNRGLSVERRLKKILNGRT